MASENLSSDEMVSESLSPEHVSEPSHTIRLVEQVASSIYKGLLAEGKSVSSAQVAAATLAALAVSSFEEADVKQLEIPTLGKLANMERKVYAFFHSAVAAREISTLYELSENLSREEGVKHFEDLGLGPLIHHPLVHEIFAPPSGAKIHKITSAEVVDFLCVYIDNLATGNEIQIEEFLQFVAHKRHLPSTTHLCIKVQSLSLHLAFIGRAKKEEKEMVGVWEARRRAEFAKKQKQKVMKGVMSSIKADTRKVLAIGKRKFTNLSLDSDSSSTAAENTNDVVEAPPTALVH